MQKWNIFLSVKFKHLAVFNYMRVKIWVTSMTVLLDPEQAVYFCVLEVQTLQIAQTLHSDHRDHSLMQLTEVFKAPHLTIQNDSQRTTALPDVMHNDRPNKAQEKKTKMFASFFYGYMKLYLPRHSAVTHSIQSKVQN